MAKTRCKHGHKIEEGSHRFRSKDNAFICCVCEREWSRSWRKRNAQKLSETVSRWRKENKDKVAVSDRRGALKRYGLTEGAYDILFEAQHGKCAICGEEETSRRYDNLSVDHHHESGVIRGLLCSKCNRAIGLIGDSMESAQRLVEYLNRFYSWYYSESNMKGKGKKAAPKKGKKGGYEKARKNVFGLK